MPENVRLVTETPGYCTVNLVTSFEKLDLNFQKTLYQRAAMHAMNTVVNEIKEFH